MQDSEDLTGAVPVKGDACPTGRAAGQWDLVVHLALAVDDVDTLVGAGHCMQAAMVLDKQWGGIKSKEGVTVSLTM